MIIDDDEDITNLFKTFLQYNGYNIDVYTDSVEAFHNFRKDSWFDYTGFEDATDGWNKII